MRITTSRSRSPGTSSWGLRALAAVSASRPALAIVDVQLQDMTGHALVAD